MEAWQIFWIHAAEFEVIIRPCFEAVVLLGLVCCLVIYIYYIIYIVTIKFTFGKLLKVNISHLARTKSKHLLKINHGDCTYCQGLMHFLCNLLIIGFQIWSEPSGVCFLLWLYLKFLSEFTSNFRYQSALPVHAAVQHNSKLGYTVFRQVVFPSPFPIPLSKFNALSCLYWLSFINTMSWHIHTPCRASYFIWIKRTKL